MATDFSDRGLGQMLDNIEDAIIVARKILDGRKHGSLSMATSEIYYTAVDLSSALDKIIEMEDTDD